MENHFAMEIPLQSQDRCFPKTKKSSPRRESPVSHLPACAVGISTGSIGMVAAASLGQSLCCSGWV